MDSLNGHKYGLLGLLNVRAILKSPAPLAVEFVARAIADIDCWRFTVR